jgi:error-prone DNA polymerase
MPPTPSAFLRGASQPEQLIERAVALEMPAMALLDRNGVYGSARFHTSAKRNKIRAHIGAEVAWDFCRHLTPLGWLPHRHLAEPARLPLLCESRQEYQNLCQLITQFKMREVTKNDGTATFNDLQQFASGLICLTGGDEGPLAAALVKGGESAAHEVLEKLMYAFGRENVYVELQRHGEREQEWRNQAMLRMARSVEAANCRYKWCSLRKRLRPRDSRYFDSDPTSHHARSGRSTFSIQ